MRGFSIKVERHFFQQGRTDKGSEVRYHVTGCVNSVSAVCQSLWEFWLILEQTFENPVLFDSSRTKSELY